MEKIDFSKYTAKGLKAMAKDAGLEKMGNKTKDILIENLETTDLSALDLDSYEILAEPVEEVAQPKAVKVPTSGRRSANPKRFGRR